MTNQPTEQETAVPEPGQIWLRKRASAALVRRVRAVENGKVLYEVLHGPASCRRKPLGSCNVRSFVQHAQQIEEQADYSHLDGAKQFDTFLVLSTKGEPLLRCSQKRADFYLKKGFARPVDGRRFAVHRHDHGETLADLYLGEFSQFFLAVKNDACVCCGRGDRLSRHHVVPKRHKKKVPMPWRNCLSNVLFVCLDCHEKYEQTPEPDLAAGGLAGVRLCLEGAFHPGDAAEVPAGGLGHRVGDEFGGGGEGRGVISRHLLRRLP